MKTVWGFMVRFHILGMLTIGRKREWPLSISLRQKAVRFRSAVRPPSILKLNI